MEFESVKEGKTLVVKLKGRLDALSAPQCDERFAKWIREGENNFIIDFRDTEYISSAGLRSVLTVGKSMKTQNGRIVLCNMNKVVKNIFQMSGFSSIFAIRDTLEEAFGEP